MRLEIYITAAGAAKSRNPAQRIISEGKIYVNGKKITKSSYEVVEGDKVELRGEDMRYVSRGGLKLEHAIDSFKIDCTDRICIDIGASTGGFTDCLLQHGAKKVYAIDSGRDQLDSSLLTDERVVSIESFNARELTLETVGEYCSLAVMDVSFISQTLLYDSVCRVLGEDGMFVSLIKPQFEAGRSSLGKNGIVKRKEDRIAAIMRVLQCAAENGLSFEGLIPSPIKGGDGNEEFLASFVLNKSTEAVCPSVGDIKKTLIER
jgi:23S rRNA (cytidine1920-2'-O)/16S rRNA (cytidine1409-2'-O)-methyltransferase